MTSKSLPWANTVFPWSRIQGWPATSTQRDQSAARNSSMLVVRTAVPISGGRSERSFCTITAPKDTPEIAPEFNDSAMTFPMEPKPTMPTDKDSTRRRLTSWPADIARRDGRNTCTHPGFTKRPNILSTLLIHLILKPKQVCIRRIAVTKSGGEGRNNKLDWDIVNYIGIYWGELWRWLFNVMLAYIARARTTHTQIYIYIHPSATRLPLNSAAALWALAGAFFPCLNLFGFVHKDLKLELVPSADWTLQC